MSTYPSSIATVIFKCRFPPPMAASSDRFFYKSRVHISNTHSVRLCLANSSHTSTDESSDFNKSSVEKQDFHGKDEKNQPIQSNNTLERLKRYGVAGFLSYGLLNTAYYLTTFLVVWFYVAPTPGKMGYLAAAERFLKILAMVWAGSQVTKIVRAAGALALAPIVDRGLTWFTHKFGFQSQGKAFAAVAGFCFGLAFLMFVVITLLWA